MTKNALIICNFRLRNIDEFNEILLKFKGSKYVIVADKNKNILGVVWHGLNLF